MRDGLGDGRIRGDPLLVSSRLEDPEQDLQFTEGKLLTVRGGQAALEVRDDAIYLAVSVRNVGTGLAVLLGWHAEPGVSRERSHVPLDEFAPQLRDIYVPPADIGFWQGALRDPTAEVFKAVGAAIEAAQPLTISVLYGDFEGGQRVISQFILRHQGQRCLVSAGRHFQLDQPDPREGE